MNANNMSYLRCFCNGESFAVLPQLKRNLVDVPRFEGAELLEKLGGEGLALLEPSKMKDFCCKVYKADGSDVACAGGISSA